MIHASDTHSPATTFSPPSRLRKPSASEIREFGERAGTVLEAQNAKHRLAYRLYALTNSPVFSWRAAGALHSFYPAGEGGQLALTAPQKDVIASAARLMLFALHSSEDEAYRIACIVGRLSDCRKDHAVLFMDALSLAAGDSPEFARMALEGFPERTTDPSILSNYVSTFFLLRAMGGEKPALAFAELFSHVGRFPGSARAMAEFLSFYVENIRIRDLGGFMESFSRDWMRTLDSEVFRENPPD